MRPNELSNVQWYYPVLKTSEDRRSTRVDVEPPRSWRLQGVDGLVEGGLRPFPGFVQVHEFLPLDPFVWPNHNNTSSILEFFPVTFLVGSDGYGYGFVYRIRRKTVSVGVESLVCDVFVDYWDSKKKVWTRNVLLMSGVPVPRRESNLDGRQMSVSVFGQFVYVFVEGEQPIAFSVEKESPWAAVVQTNTGPGKQPLMLSFDETPGLGAVLDGLNAKRPAVGQIFLTEFEPTLASGLGLGGGTSTDDGVVGQRDQDATKLVPGDYAFAFQLHNSANGRKSALSEVAQIRTADFVIPTTPSTTTNRPLAQYAAMQIDYDDTKYDQAYIYRSVKVQDAGGTYIAGILHLDAVINLAEFHTTNNGTAPYDGDYKQAVYYFEAEDKQLVYQMVFQDRALFDDNMPAGGASLWYENTMLVSKILNPLPSAEDKPRPGDAFRGVGEVRWSSLVEISPELYPPSNRYLPDLTANSVKVFKTVYPNVAGFSSDRMYLVRKEGTIIKISPIHEGFGTINQFTAESVGSMVYFLTPKGMKTLDSNAQLDAVNSLNELLFKDWAGSLESISMAYDPTLSMLFVLNDVENEGQLLWFNSGMVTSLVDVPFRMCARGNWPLNFAFDKANLNSAAGAGNSTYENELVERSFFLDESSRTSTAPPPAGFRFRVFMVDYRREKRQTHGDVNAFQGTMLPYAGHSTHVVANNFNAGFALSIGGGAVVFPEGCWGLSLYVVSSSNPALVGRSARVHSRPSPSSVFLYAEDSSNLHGLKAGDKVALSPVNFEWVGHPLGVKDPEGYDFGTAGDFFKVRHVSDVMASFVDVGGTEAGGVDVLDRFYGLAYRGNQDEPAVVAFTVDERGNLVRSVVPDDPRRSAAFGDGNGGSGRAQTGIYGTTISPGIRVVCPNLDFLLTSVMVNGRMAATMMKDRGGSR
jgi:hypothetical protein